MCSDNIYSVYRKSKGKVFSTILSALCTRFSLNKRNNKIALILIMSMRVSEADGREQQTRLDRLNPSKRKLGKFSLFS